MGCGYFKVTWSILGIFSLSLGFILVILGVC